MVLPLPTDTPPTPLFIVAELAFVVVQLSVLPPPAVILVGLADSVALATGVVLVSLIVIVPLVAKTVPLVLYARILTVKLSATYVT